MFDLLHAISGRLRMRVLSEDLAPMVMISMPHVVVRPSWLSPAGNTRHGMIVTMIESHDDEPHLPL